MYFILVSPLYPPESIALEVDRILSRFRFKNMKDVDRKKELADKKSMRQGASNSIR
jgi:hypothetical protein